MRCWRHSPLTTDNRNASFRSDSAFIGTRWSPRSITWSAQGLAKRLPHPDDRRAVAVTLTAKARRLLPALDKQASALEDQIAAPLSSRERDTLRRLLQRVAAEAGLIPGVHPQLA